MKSVKCENIDGFHENLQDSVVSAVFDMWQKVGKESRLKVFGISMSPLIRSKDLVITRHAKDDIRIGTIIAYRKEQKIIVHRVIQIQRNYDKPIYITRGDFNLHDDPPVGEDKVIGKVIAVEKGKQIFQLDSKFWQVVGYILATRSSIVRSTYKRILSYNIKFVNKTILLLAKSRIVSR